MIFEKQGDIGVVYLNEPTKMNALSMALKRELLNTLYTIQQQDIKILVITGNGKGFCAGGDLIAMQEVYDALAIKESMEISKQIVQQLRTLPQLTISVVNGFAAGAGFSLALSTDFAIAEEQAKFVIAFKNVGLIPDLGLHYHLQKALGSRIAKEWVYEGKILTALEAQNYQFVNKVVAKNHGLEHALKLAEELLAGPIEAYKASKRIFNELEDAQLKQVMETENLVQVILRGESEHKECLKQFLQNKKVKT
ncbi:enoyl-CoA hydratase/isomerase family protein [Solibacillus sp. FSL K6-4121]|uniref:enoyl-CoA hydratase/isomerase family protein n=1 Tax=Solibacillus sp. FSL K6-4121 TaxID=2921505 RepID=UPI0030F82AD7